MKTRGLLFCLVGAAGSGKTSLGQSLLEKHSDLLQRSISATTRAPRNDEQDGVSYFFFGREEFQRRIEQGFFFEWEEVHGNYYGTSRDFIEQRLQQNKNLLLDIDIRGAFSFKRSYPANTVIVFLLPPSKSTLVERLKARGSMDEGELQRRLETSAREHYTLQESAGKEVSADYIVVNDRFEHTLETLGAILLAELQRFERFDLSLLSEFQ